MRRFSNYESALSVLSTASEQDLDNEFIQGGVIDRFFIQFELGWKLLKALLAYEGNPLAASGSPRDIIKAAYAYHGFLDEGLWLQMLRARIDTAHIYDGERAGRMVATIIDSYIPEFVCACATRWSSGTGAFSSSSG